MRKELQCEKSIWIDSFVLCVWLEEMIEKIVLLLRVLTLFITDILNSKKTQPRRSKYHIVFSYRFGCCLEVAWWFEKCLPMAETRKLTDKQKRSEIFHLWLGTSSFMLPRLIRFRTKLSLCIKRLKNFASTAHARRPTTKTYVFELLVYVVNR